MIPDRNTATTTLRDATHPDDPTATDAWLATGPCVQFSDAMTHIGHACDQALADARLITTRDLDGPLHGLVTDLRREKAAAVACRAIFESHLAAAVGEMRALSQATDDMYMVICAQPLEKVKVPSRSRSYLFILEILGATSRRGCRITAR